MTAILPIRVYAAACVDGVTESCLHLKVRLERFTRVPSLLTHNVFPLVLIRGYVSDLSDFFVLSTEDMFMAINNRSLFF